MTKNEMTEHRNRIADSLSWMKTNDLIEMIMDKMTDEEAEEGWQFDD